MMASALIEREQESRPYPLRTGCFVAVVGPSGAGKDTLIDLAREAFAGDRDVHFVRRVVTRTSEAGGEDHDTLSLPAFEAAEKAGEFAISWRAHGLCYGLPAEIDRHMASGLAVVANLSRAALPDLKARYANVVVAAVTAQPDVLADRLAARGRETREEILARLSRLPGDAGRVAGAVEIPNNEKPDEAGRQLVGLIRKALAGAAVSDIV
ncbi:MAG: phosphonate metabolism protein/1,5-bisphosphokinase (PRPP-forming) PhnN [Rhizobiaceae bacterium]